MDSRDNSQSQTLLSGNLYLYPTKNLRHRVGESPLVTQVPTKGTLGGSENHANSRYRLKQTATRYGTVQVANHVLQL